ncbi:hypothetical protein [Mesorhizobium sp.]|uniref:hypothetical protein n=1 Tax=Mesorhizobium sp. TaxID=1871066 RepID=UPI00121C1088|nr:hypothetical protein [Mesorhizobium sp.]TIW95948.1 MAG: hypothetical protein E5V45_21830 [Mesorhizobium sp.]
MFGDGGQFYPYQPIQFMDGLLNPLIGAAPTFDVVGTPTSGDNGSSNTTSSTVTFPTGFVAGELLLLWFASDNLITPTTPSGWTSLYTASNGGIRFTGYYKQATGSEGASMVVSHGSCQTAWGCLHVTGQTSSVPEATSVGASSSAPNPPSLTPSWGSASDLWFAAAAQWGFSITAGPAGYTNVINKAKGTNNFALRVDYLKATATSQDPAAFTSGGSNSNGASTTAVH